jgi:hypothetical protein
MVVIRRDQSSKGKASVQKRDQDQILDRGSASRVFTRTVGSQEEWKDKGKEKCDHDQIRYASRVFSRWIIDLSGRIG